MVDKLMARDLVSDRRRIRAQSLAAIVMQVLDDLLEPDEEWPKKKREAAYRLCDLFHQKGFDVITDEDRARAGLPKRGELGWTDHELRVMEHARTLTMLAPIEPMIFPAALNETEEGRT